MQSRAMVGSGFFSATRAAAPISAKGRRGIGFPPHPRVTEADHHSAHPTGVLSPKQVTSHIFLSQQFGSNLDRQLGPRGFLERWRTTPPETPPRPTSRAQKWNGWAFKKMNGLNFAWEPCFSRRGSWIFLDDMNNP